MKNQGFTLVELVLTIVLVSILSVVAVSQFSLDTTRLDLAEDKLVGDIQYAKRLAMTKGITHGIFFEPAFERYTVFEGTVATPLPDPADRSQNFIIDYTTESSFEGVTMTSANFSGSSTLTFNGEGAPVDAGNVVIAFGAQSRTMTVTPNTGKVTTP
ncbi:MAG: prepilin-type N-terminal cleavage/methylation domain-containing protein [Deltaproteobacteria bacterium]|nr:prepilin-type N-terminal cleavage/methylation domain-containing protein [Deltaproteobacteria bacterium]